MNEATGNKKKEKKKKKQNYHYRYYIVDNIFKLAAQPTLLSTILFRSLIFPNIPNCHTSQ